MFLFGPVAHLVERYIRIVEVRSSSLLRSTILRMGFGRQAIRLSASDQLADGGLLMAFSQKNVAGL